MSFGPEEEPREYLPQPVPSTGRELLPGIFLIIVGVVNLLLAAGGIYVSVAFNQIPHAELQKAYSDLPQDQRDAMKQIGINGPEDLRNFYVRFGLILGVIWGVAALPTLLGGILTCARRARGLAIFGAIVAMLPVASPSCCLLIGLGVGIWALVVLLSPDVKASFR